MSSGKRFYKNTASGALWEWTPQLEEHAAKSSHLVLCNENGIEIAVPVKGVRSYKEMAGDTATGTKAKKSHPVQAQLTDD